MDQANTGGAIEAASPGPAAFPLRWAALVISGAALAPGAGAWALAWGWGGLGAQRAVALMAGAVWVGAMLSLAPMLVAGGGVLAVLRAWFLGTAVRLVLCLGVLAAGVKLWGLPPGPLAGSLMACYLPVLFAEVRLVMRHIRAQPAPARTSVASTARPGGTPSATVE